MAQSSQASLEALYPNLNKNYKHLSEHDVSHFLEHSWMVIPNALNPQIIDEWMSTLFTRMGMSEHDKSTWTTEYMHMAQHREVPPEALCPEAWQKINEICGGGIMVQNRIDPEREGWLGDAFIVNLGTEAKSKPEYHQPAPNTKQGWHVDNDSYRLFLDSQGTALTLLLCWTDIKPEGGGTWFCEDGMTRESV
jgi:hypothetical protein